MTEQGFLSLRRKVSCWAELTCPIIIIMKKGNIWGIWWLAEGSIGAAFYFDGLLNVCILTISLMSLKMDPKVNLTESLPLKVREIQRVGRLSMFWSWFDFQLRGGLGLLLYLSDGEATKTLGGSGAFCFITWKWDTLPLPFGKSISSLLPLSHWIPSCRLLLETSSQSSVDAIDSWIAFTNTARSQNY